MTLTTAGSVHCEGCGCYDKQDPKDSRPWPVRLDALIDAGWTEERNSSGGLDHYCPKCTRTRSHLAMAGHRRY